jgi:uncharacterized protein YoaH (UPF0181 family)
MGGVAEMIEAMKAVGISDAQALAAVAKMDELRREKTREANRVRQQRFREKPSSNENEVGNARNEHNVNNAGNALQRDEDGPESECIYNHAGARVFPVGSSLRSEPLVTPSATHSPPKAAARSARCERFGEFWSAYPRRVGRKEAESKFAAAVKAGADPAKLVSAAERFAEAHRMARTEARFVPHPATWLQQGRYDDEELPTPQARAGPARSDRNGFLTLLTERMEDKLGQRHFPEKRSDPEAFRVLPVIADDRPGSGRDDGGELSGNPVEILIEGSFRRM